MSRESPSAGWREVYREMGVDEATDDGGDGWDWNPSIVTPDGEEVHIERTESMSDQREREVARVLKDSGAMTRPEIQRRLGSNHGLVRGSLDDLRAQGYVASRRDGQHIVYWWVGNDKGREAPRRGPTDTDLLDEIRRLADGFIPPSKDEMRIDGRFSKDIYNTRFGSWNNAVEAAGFDPRTPGVKKHEQRTAVEGTDGD